MAISFSMAETLLICQNYIPNFEHLCKSIPKLSFLLLARPSPVRQLTVQPVTSHADSIEPLRTDSSREGPFCTALFEE